MRRPVLFVVAIILLPLFGCELPIGEKPSLFQITFDANGGTGTMQP